MHTNEFRDTTQFIGTALDILEQDGPMTFRQLFWRLVSAGQIHNNVENYDRLRQIMTRVSEAGRCHSEWIVNRSRAALTIDGN